MSLARSRPSNIDRRAPNLWAMTAPSYGLVLAIRVDLLRTESGGRVHPIRTGYRPICAVTTPDGQDRMIGLCQLSIDGDLRPGETGIAELSFANSVSDLARSLLRVGSRFYLAEGPHHIGTAEVLSIQA